MRILQAEVWRAAGCRPHHFRQRAFIISVNPDYIIHVRKDVLDEEDGPMLQHGLKELHKARIILPRAEHHWPNREYLDRRFQKFMAYA